MQDVGANRILVMVVTPKPQEPLASCKALKPSCLQVAEPSGQGFVPAFYE